jgi:hypothetical protein
MASTNAHNVFNDFFYIKEVQISNTLAQGKNRPNGEISANLSKPTITGYVRE